jgi:hypothetical protein
VRDVLEEEEDDAGEPGTAGVCFIATAGASEVGKAPSLRHLLDLLSGVEVGGGLAVWKAEGGIVSLVACLRPGKRGGKRVWLF